MQRPGLHAQWHASGVKRHCVKAANMGGHGLRLAANRLDVAAHLAVDGNAIAQRVNAVDARGQGFGLHFNAVVPRH